jgi:hypothetical protein
MSCDRCGTKFEHQAGVGLIFECVGCGESNDERSPFYSPVCHRCFDLQAEHFERSLCGVVYWD